MDSSFEKNYIREQAISGSMIQQKHREAGRAWRMQWMRTGRDGGDQRPAHRIRFR